MTCRIDLGSTLHIYLGYSFTYLPTAASVDAARAICRQVAFAVRHVLTVLFQALREVRYELRCFRKLFTDARHDLTLVRHDDLDERY